SDPVGADEGIRPGTTTETLAQLKPAFKQDGKVTAGNSSQITDGAAAVLIMSEEKANQLGLKPRARFVQFALAGVDPVMMLTGPIPATAKVLEKAKLSMDDMDLTEINEAFASVVLAWEKELHPDMSKVNVNGGAIARPLPEPPPAGELRKVKLTYRCSICGTEVRMTTANDQMPEPPRHCLEDMDLVTPVDDL